ncbi:MAG: SCP2 sterol-binding domain-containing protein [Methanobacteriota archaeon]|nr:MAG: SCP2 sterol-binding domain-containing protein [Euryarchaeota archaeon]
MVEELLRTAIDKFNGKVAEDPALAKELEGVSKTIQLEVEDGEWYHFRLQDGRVDGPHGGAAESPDIRIIASADTLTRLWSRKLRVMKALATRKLQVKGSIEDLLRLRRFF